MNPDKIATGVMAVDREKSVFELQLEDVKRQLGVAIDMIWKFDDMRGYDYFVRTAKDHIVDALAVLDNMEEAEARKPTLLTLQEDAKYLMDEGVICEFVLLGGPRRAEHMAETGEDTDPTDRATGGGLKGKN